ncbi:hypothetical protein FNF27_01734 [Cafeteria roenbergensis]|uniref:Uncharacterized protein n=1 Tax=Cafeteria roenbergensis TaxID=33653 RepID=A0A5A8DAE7_CAFRO|nr:hypothetical protein FNF29_07347 [Cafeteria roenbergensis]KAA0162346.1 hypothetical protein FNF28_04765 [Cafeteria roenbergensis]KAA0167740.1 hypothetical protein FNF31_00675 [Cafeteria roenbergensis]KAA0176912.1 hypothetical protein FNF27_01734 [Cafeteria roenbergensis]|eukprot:KAA0147501.1 hypothetical protein FNF29_07347 [Cafeteria roenbergensis]
MATTVRSRAWLTRLVSAGAGVLIVGMAFLSRSMTDQDGVKHREYLVTMADRVDREKILDALDKAEAAAPPAPAASEAERR